MNNIRADNSSPNQDFMFANTIVIEMNGTLTRNEMIVSQLIVDHKRIFVSGKGYDPYGTLLCDGASVTISSGSSLYMLAQAAYLLGQEVTISINERGSYAINGNSMDAALQVLAAKMGITLHDIQLFKKVDEIIVENQYHAVLYEYHKKGIIFIAGCPELLVKNRALHNDIQSLQQQGLHTRAIAYKACEIHDDVKSAIHESVLLGICGIEDTIRHDAIAAIAKARKAGFHVIMTSPQHQQTAIAIAQKMGIYKAGDEAIDGQELHHKGSHYLHEQIMHATVYSNITREQKLSIIAALKDKGASVIEVEQTVSFSALMRTMEKMRRTRVKRQRMVVQGMRASVMVMATIGTFWLFAPFNRVLAMTMSFVVFNTNVCLMAYARHPLIALFLIIAQFSTLSLNPYQWIFALMISSSTALIFFVFPYQDDESRR